MKIAKECNKSIEQIRSILVFFIRIRIFLEIREALKIY